MYLLFPSIPQPGPRQELALSSWLCLEPLLCLTVSVGQEAWGLETGQSCPSLCDLASPPCPHLSSPLTKLRPVQTPDLRSKFLERKREEGPG